MKAMFAMVCVLVLAGCAVTIPIGDHTTRVGLSAPEAAWQTVNFVDFGQTMTIARRPNVYYENGIPARYVIVSHPSEGEVAGYFAVRALLHFTVSSWLDREVEENDSAAWRNARIAWYAISLAISGGAVIDNATKGIGLFESSSHATLCTPGKPPPLGESCVFPAH